MLGRVRAVLLLCLVASLAAGETLTLTLTAAPLPAGRVLALAGECFGSAWEFDHDLLDQGLAASPVHLGLVQTGADGVAQALGQALGVWVCPRPGGGRLFTRSRLLPLTPPSARPFTSRLDAERAGEDLVRELLAPWMGADCGIAFHPFQGRWLATLNGEGQVRLGDVLGILEDPRPRIPPLTGDPGAPDPQARCETPLAARDWPGFVQVAAAAGLGVSLAPALAASRPTSPIGVPPGRLDELPARLSTTGVMARWVSGILCLHPSDTPRPARHPALRRNLAVLPVGRFGDSPAALALRLRREAAAWWWDQPGAVIRPLPGTTSLLVAADDEALAEVLARLRRLDCEGR